jgi:hypothetical protein
LEFHSNKWIEKGKSGLCTWAQPTVGIGLLSQGGPAHLGPFGPRPSAGEAGGLLTDGRLSGKIGSMSLPEPRGILLGGQTGRELTEAWLVMAMAVGRRGAPMRG